MTYPAGVVRRALGLIDEGMTSPEVEADIGVPAATVRRWRRRRERDPSWPHEPQPCPADLHAATHHAYAKGCRCPEARAAKREWQRGWYKSRAMRQPRLVPAVGTLRRIQGLMLLGWTKRDIAEAGGLSPESVKSINYVTQTHVTVATEAGVRRATRALVARGRGPSTHTANRARKHGYAPPLAWDDDTIDDPAARPNIGTKVNGYSTRKLPDAERLAAEVNGSSVAVVAGRYEVARRSVAKALRRAGYRAVVNGHEATYVREEAA